MSSIVVSRSIHRFASKLNLTLPNVSPKRRLAISFHLPAAKQRVLQNKSCNSNERNLKAKFVRLHSSQAPRPYVDPKYSYAFCKSNDHLLYSNIDREFRKQVALRPNDIAYVSYIENKQVNFSQFNHDVNMLTKSLTKDFDISKSDTVGVFAYNCYNWIVAQFACSRIGAILTPINPSYKAHELSFILKKGKVKCLLMHGPKSIQSTLNNHLQVLQSDQIIELAKLSELQLRDVILMDSENEYIFGATRSPDLDSDSFIDTTKINNCNFHNWNETLNDGIIFESINEAEEANVCEQDACIIDPLNISPDDPFATYYTSGTTGLPKGASVSHFTVLNNIRFAQSRLRQGRSKDWKIVLATTLPMFHIFAGVLNTLSPIIGSSHVVYSSYKYDIEAFVNSIISYQANVITVTPTILIDMLAFIEAKKLTDIPLRVVQSGGATLAPEVALQTFRVLPKLEELRTGYGSTENGAVATLQTIHEPAHLRPETVGQPLDFTAVRIVKPNTSIVLAHGERGEIQTRGYNTMIEYYDEPERTREVLGRDMWYKTGDIGFMHPNGSIQISGRIKQMIIKGGENIYPEEVEQLIHKLDCVQDNHVIGVPDERFGEQVCAWIKLKPGYKEVKSKEAKQSEMDVCVQDIVDFCRENITYFKVPRYVLFVDSFPMTPTKKVQNHLMVEESVKLLNLQQKQ